MGSARHSPRLRAAAPPTACFSDSTLDGSSINQEMLEMKPLALFGLLVLGSLAAGCGSDTPTTPSTASSATFTATLLPSSEVPAVTGTEAGGSGTGTVTLNLTKDSAGSVMAAT